MIQRSWLGPGAQAVQLSEETTKQGAGRGTVEEGVCEHRGTSLAQGEEDVGQQVVRKQEMMTSLPQETVTQR